MCRRDRSLMGTAVSFTYTESFTGISHEVKDVKITGYGFHDWTWICRDLESGWEYGISIIRGIIECKFRIAILWKGNNYKGGPWVNRYNPITGQYEVIE